MPKRGMRYASKEEQARRERILTEMYREGRPVRDISERLGICQSTVCDIAARLGLRLRRERKKLDTPQKRAAM